VNFTSYGATVNL